MSGPAPYSLPQGIVGLKGPMDRPAPGTLPLRGDLAHIALADRYLAAHYVIPQTRRLGDASATLRLAPHTGAEDGATLDGGTQVELLDEAGDWAWIACGPDGPSGYLPRNVLKPADDA